MIKKLKIKRRLLFQEIKGLRKNLKSLIKEAELSSGKRREEALDRIESTNQQYGQLAKEIDAVTDEIRSRRAHNRTKHAHTRRIHDVAGRQVDPTGFSGVVQGGAPGLGKRK
ncbi:MAG: hypothetical protein VX549_00425 [Pseudomonadota bacterium]|nr:hypothetical protein [Pseudomonadota bacterium]